MEDMYDTGNSLSVIYAALKEYQPKSLKSAIVFHKKNSKNLKYNFYADYIGFFIPDYFVFGYGLDNNEYLRELPHLCVLSKEGLEAYKTDWLIFGIS